MYLYLNPLPHGVLTTFFPTAGGLIGPPKNDDISKEKTILMTSLRTHKASAVSRPGLHYTYSPLPVIGHCVHCLEPDHILAYNFLRFWILYLFQFSYCINNAS